MEGRGEPSAAVTTDHLIVTPAIEITVISTIYVNTNQNVSPNLSAPPNASPPL